MKFTRAAGILLPISSLPGSYGIGDLGSPALAFIDWLSEAQQRWWQFLPLGPVDKTNNPYSALSSWAGNPLVVSLDSLVEKGDLQSSETKSARMEDNSKINYRRVSAAKFELLELAASRFFASNTSENDLFLAFCKKQKWWLDSWALFAAAKSVLKGKPWWKWGVLSDPSSGQWVEFENKEKKLIEVQKYIQFRFFQQWEIMRDYAASKGISLLGDVPIYCAADSQDVWSQQDMFKLMADGTPRGKAGVPPDYFSETGQLWGNPVYDWPKHQAQGFRWWMSRLKGCFDYMDAVRIDHFRGLESYWEVPGNATTAQFGEWCPGPGDDFFKAVQEEFGDAPIIAEDLGIITPEVERLRDSWQLPGMRVLQFAFGGDSSNVHLPHWYSRSSIVYTGTHDNDTTRGWYSSASKDERLRFQLFTGTTRQPHIQLTKMAYASVADLAVVQMQDVLGLGASARLNLPGKTLPGGNFRWKLMKRQLSLKAAHRLGDLVQLYSRAG